MTWWTRPEQEREQRLADALALPAGYVEATEGSTAVAAAAPVAIGARMPTPDRATVGDFFSSRSIPTSPELRHAAKAALERVAAEDSELSELWHDAGHTEAVTAFYDSIRRAL